MSDTTTGVHHGPSPIPAHYQPDPHPVGPFRVRPDAKAPEITPPRETRYELATEGQRNALKRLQSAYSHALDHAQRAAQDARSTYMEGMGLMLLGMGAEPKPGQAVRVEGNALVVVESGEASSAQPAPQG